MQILVKADRTITIEIESTDTIDHLMLKIYDRTRIPPGDQLLKFGTKKLIPERTVMESGIKGGDTVHVSFRIRGADITLLKRGYSGVLKCKPEALGLQEEFRVRIMSRNFTYRIWASEDVYQRLIMPEFKIYIGNDVRVVRQVNHTHYLGFNGNGWGYFETKYAQRIETPINNRIPATEKKKSLLSLLRSKIRRGAIRHPLEAISRSPKNELLFNEYFPKKDNEDIRPGRCRAIAHYDLLPLKQGQFCRTLKINLKLTRGGRYHFNSFTLYIYFDIGLVSKVNYSATRAANNGSVNRQTNESAGNPFTPNLMTMTDKHTMSKKENASIQAGFNISKATGQATYGFEEQTGDTREIEAQFLTTASIIPSGGGSPTASWVVKQGSLPNGIPLDDFDLVLGLQLDSVPLIIGYTIEAYTVVAYQDTQQHLRESPTLSTTSYAQCLNTGKFYEIPR